jgi:hypothetical protein
VGTIATFEGSELRTVAVDPANDHTFVNEKTHINEYKSAAEGSGLISNTIGSGTLSSSFGIAVDGASGDVYAGDSFAGLVYKLAPPAYSSLESCNGASAKEGPFTNGNLQNIAVDQKNGHLFVDDLKHGVIDEFDSSCGFVEQIGPKFGAESISLKDVSAVDLAIDSGGFSPNNGNVYLTSGSSVKARLFAFGPLEEPRPEVTTGAATEATPTSATLYGTVDPNTLLLKDCHFEYVSEAEFGASGFANAEGVSCAENAAEIGTGTEPVSVHAILSGLPAGAYRFRLSAENENPPADKGGVAAFGPPSIVAKPAFPTLFTEATVRAEINPEGFSTVYRVEYGLTKDYGQSTGEVELAPGAEPIPIQAVLTGLQPGTEYHYRILATSAVSANAGMDKTLTTLSRPPGGLCPNAQFRDGASAVLPDCRAFEMVSPPNMGTLNPTWPANDAVDGNFNFSLAGVDGTSAVYMTEGTLPKSAGNGVRDAHRAARGPDGWTSSLFSPSGAQTDGVGPGGVSSDQFSSFWAATGTNGSLDPLAGVAAHYVRRPGGVIDLKCSPEPQGDFELIGCGSLGVDPEAVGRWITEGGSHILFTTAAGCGVCTPAVRLEPNAPPDGIGAIYDR